MKQLRYRAVMVLCFIAFLALGVGFFCVRYVTQGADWAGSKVNAGAYSSGKLKSGAIYDVNGVLLYDAEDGSYAADKTVRKAVLHLTGDADGNIGVSATKVFSSHLVGFNPVTGSSLGGHKLYLTIDSRINAAAYEALGGKKGAVAVYNYKTGDLVCSVSAPSFDPGRPPVIRDGDENYEGVYINRVFSGLYAPGSTFKLVTGAAALEEFSDPLSRRYTCSGSVTIGDETVTCPVAHGEMDFAGALANSCNCAFAEWAVELGSDTLRKYFENAGLSEALSVNGIAVAAGSYGIPETEGALGWSGVGQFEDMVNPCAMLRYVGAIANGGSGITPNLIAKETLAGGRSVPANVHTESETLLKRSTAETLKSLMRNNVTETYGQSMFGELCVCAKSGTAEVGEGRRPHSWFVGFVDDEELPLAFVVVIQNGGSGASVAGKAAAEILQAADAVLRTGTN